MGIQNSRIEILLGVIRNLLDDIATLIENSAVLRAHNGPNPRRDCDRDFAYISARALHEGETFLTSRLPLLGKWYDSKLSLDNGCVLLGFKPYHNAVGKANQVEYTCPLLCRMLAFHIHAASGPSADLARLIRAYRSLFYLYYKLETPLSDSAIQKALSQWFANEAELKEFEYPEYFASDLFLARDLIAGIIGDESTFTKIVPRHGPGAVAGGEDNIEKWETAHYIPSLHRVYPRYDYYLGWRSDGRISPTMASMIIDFTKKSRVVEAVSRLLFVPKDSRGPRTISCEPKELMFIQQGVARNLMKLLNHNSHGRINFVDQSINGNIALTSSLSGEFATIDLKDASDRVSLKLVKLVFPDWAHRYLDATRSHSTLLPDGSEFVGHEKYAPMGSALCFPIESAVFWALAVVAGVNSGMTVTEAKASTYVYGDDIIIRPEVFGDLLKTYSSVGLKVNVDKSFVEGPFRESCGVDAWNGFNVTPLKIKKDICCRSLDGNLAMAICKYASRCFEFDFRNTGEMLYQLVNSHYPGIIRSTAELGCLHVVDPIPQDIYIESGYDRRLCRMWVKGWVLSTPKKPLLLHGLSRLLRSYYMNWEEHDPSTVAVLRSAKIRKRKVLVDGYIV